MITAEWTNTDNLSVQNSGSTACPSSTVWIEKNTKSMPTVEAIPIEWLKENLIGTEFHFGKGVDNTLAGEIVWQIIVDWWREDNGDKWWQEEQNNE